MPFSVQINDAVIIDLILYFRNVKQKCILSRNETEHPNQNI